MMFKIFDCYAHFSKNEKPQIHHVWFLVNCGNLVNQRRPGFRTESSKLWKMFFEKIAMTIHKLMKFHEQIIYDSKDTFRNVNYLAGLNSLRKGHDFSMK